MSLMSISVGVAGGAKVKRKSLDCPAEMPGSRGTLGAGATPLAG